MQNKQCTSVKEAFEMVWQHFIVEKNPPGWDPAMEIGNEKTGGCSYFVKDGHYCSVGLIVGNPRALPLSATIGGLLTEQEPQVVAIVAEEEDRGSAEDFLCRLQAAHDRCAARSISMPDTFDFHERFTKELETLKERFEHVISPVG